MKFVRFSNTTGEIFHDIQVTLFPSRRAFLRYCRSKTCDGKQISGAGCAAKMFAFPGGDASDPDAELVFYKEEFTTDSIAHEVAHGLFEVFRKVGRCDFSEKPLSAASANEELFASLCGKLTALILDWREEIKGD